MKAIFMRFCKVTYTMDLRPSEMTRRARCEKYARKNKTCGKRAVFL